MANREWNAWNGPTIFYGTCQVLHQWFPEPRMTFTVIIASSKSWPLNRARARTHFFTSHTYSLKMPLFIEF
jgi:hypothetical protein